MPYTYRTVKGSPLTHEEYDENFAYTETLFEDTEAAKDVAVSAGNFQGRWSEQFGSVAPPYAVSHNERTWALNVELFDVSASEPSEVNTDWTLLLGSVAVKDTGTAPDEVPLNSDLPTFGSAASFDVGPGATELPTNGYLGSAANRAVGLTPGDLIEITNDDVGNPGVPAISGRALTGLQHPVSVIFNASPAASYPPLYACRAWVHFDATSGVVINGSGNISSIVDEGSSRFTINFSTAMPDAHYVVVSCTSGTENGNLATGATLNYGYLAGSFSMTTGAYSGTRAYRGTNVIAVFR